MHCTNVGVRALFWHGVVLTSWRASLLTVEGSLGPAKEAEDRCYREYMARELNKFGVSSPEPLKMHPFSVEEWEQRGGGRDEDMFILGRVHL